MDGQFVLRPDGRVLAFATIGPADAKPVLFFHSLPGARLLPAFAERVAHSIGLRFVCIDRPGFGLSDFQPDRTVLDWAADVAYVADALGLERFRVFGVSAGAPYVLACCARLPERIERAGIVAGITPRDEAGIMHTALPRLIHAAVRRSRRISHLAHALLVAGMRRAPERALERLGQTLSSEDRAVLERPEAAEYIVMLSLEAARHGVRGWVYDDWLLNRPWGFAPDEVPPKLPVHLWWGDADSSVPLAHGEELAETIPGAQLRVFPGQGHFGVMFDRADEIFSELAA